jgi:UDP-glucose 4-epimerase
MKTETDSTIPPNCVVVGSNGYLGSQMAAFLQKMGCKVTGLDKEDSSHQKQIDYRKLDITDSDAFGLLPTDTEVIFFFSGLTGTRDGFAHYQEYLRVNESGLLHLLNHVKHWKRAPKIIYPSTRLVYKGAPGVLSEEAPKEAKTVYATNKIAAEYYLQAYGFVMNIPWSICRICVPYGNIPGMPYPFGTTGFFLKRAIAGLPITLFGDGSQRRTFTHAVDICRQVSAVAFSPDSSHQIYNIAGEEFSLREAAQIIAEKFGVTVDYIPWPEEDLKMESGDTVFDGTKIRSVIPDTVTISFRDWVNSLDQNLLRL